jgi:hypothetical protein
MHGSWYCSPRCFTAAAEKEVVRLQSSRAKPANHVSRMPLGLNLMSHGLVTAEQLREANDEQKKTGLAIGEILVRRGYVSEKQVTAIRAADWNCPVFAVPAQPARIGIDIPSILVDLAFMIPVHYVAASNSLLIGFVHSVEYELLYAIEQMTRCATTPCFVTPGDFQLQKRYRERSRGQPVELPAKEVTFDDVKTTPEMARILCEAALEMEADEAILGKCKHYLWARVKSGSARADLFFKIK